MIKWRDSSPNKFREIFQNAIFQKDQVKTIGVQMPYEILENADLVVEGFGSQYYPKSDSWTNHVQSDCDYASQINQLKIFRNFRVLMLKPSLSIQVVIFYTPDQLFFVLVDLLAIFRNTSFQLLVHCQKRPQGAISKRQRPFLKMNIPNTQR